MRLDKLIDEITKLSKLWHSNNCESYETSGENFDANLLIAQYILSKGKDVNIGNHKASRLIQVFLDQEVGQNEEAYCGSEEEMLLNFIQMFANQEHTLGYLIDDDPIEGKYKPVENVDKEIQMIINYFESIFWPDDITFQYNLEEFGIKKTT